MAQTNSHVETPMGGNTASEKQPMEIKRNTQYNLEEIKVRWKKAALENCLGTPCIIATVPGAPTAVIATVGNASASVAFVEPSNNGGSKIISYTVTTNPATSPITGTTSPIIVKELTNGTAYTFAVTASNVAGNSVASSSSTAVTPAPPFSCGDFIKDIDDNLYPTVLIGTQCWTKENLKVTKYNDGTSIPDSTNTTWGTAAIGARTEYVGVGTPSSGYVGTYGYLYNWYAAADTRKLCPAGWHVPTDGQWTSLIQFLVPSETLSTSSTAQSTTAGRLMKKNDALWSTNTGTNISGFSALPGGYRDVISSGISSTAFFWSATQDNVNSDYAWNRNLFTDNQVYRDNNYIGTKSVGYSIRCLMD